MKTNRKRRALSSILWIECVGFTVIIVLSWVDELINLPQRFFGSAYKSNWRESALESLVACIVWLVVFLATRRVLRRFRHLEDLLTMCAWCRKLHYREDWVSLEDYCMKELGVDVSHGMCPECGRQLLKDRPAGIS
jgi:hypothetical protein